ncbi:hypothetical protein [Arthrobacter sp. zg-Y877]|uniref:hypothetical protein n=1 Tax=Arthrobacter sp. zg-Y877 TaxID=3049074 RepID=UPI0025A4B893|nr:hypothetical protein [Arthrobacter sp. zg-Y877]MDM7989656.1 hypothetical protein [Arthrobacter sp. zg-Y877]
MPRKSLLFPALGIGSAAAVWAARTVVRMLDRRPLRLAAGLDTAGLAEPDLPVTPVPRDAVTTVTTGDPASDLPDRTWVVDEGTGWDGNPGELVVLPHSRQPPEGEPPERDKQ